MSEIVTTTPLNTILGPFEARPVSLSREDIADRRRSLALGDNLNRIQGADRHPTVDRLAHLWCSGQISRAEYYDLLGQLGRAGYLNGQDHLARG